VEKCGKPLFYKAFCAFGKEQKSIAQTLCFIRLWELFFDFWNKIGSAGLQEARIIGILKEFGLFPFHIVAKSLSPLAKSL
jgi:hypothetical protein